jgi:uncharacterized phage-like protein YoqJ
MEVYVSTMELICCFTGHRPTQLPWQYNESGIRYWAFKRRFRKAIISSIEEGYKHFISGMALGVDMIAAEIVLELKATYPDIILECALPCINQTAKWNDESIMRYQNILSLADYVTKVSDTFYFNGCMAKRNKYMVDKSSRIIACFNGKPGGTEQTIKMAEIAGLDIVIVKP